jgi:hypothetical protein
MAAAIGNGAQPSFLMLRSTPLRQAQGKLPHGEVLAAKAASLEPLEARRTVVPATSGPSFEAARTSSEPRLRMRVVDSEGDG